jgi:2-C-methyl-D-erythritol 4-phosphate cytidylyltransferase
LILKSRHIMSDAQLVKPSNNGPQRCFALIPAAGHGARAGLNHPKQYEQVAGAPMIEHTVAAFLQAPSVHAIAVVVSPADQVYAAPDDKVRVWPVGGASRAQSVFNGVNALLQAQAKPEDWVLVHDAARCLVTPAQIESLVQTCLAHANSGCDLPGGLLALPLPDTLKLQLPRVPAEAQTLPRVGQTLERADKWLAQTPQMFRLGDLQRALCEAAAHNFAGITDEASAIEALGGQPLLVLGSAQNFKVTYPDDFVLAEALLRKRQTSC